MVFGRFYKNVAKELKTYMSCFIFFSYSLIESAVIKCCNFYFFDFGFKYLAKIKKTFRFNTLTFIALKIIKLETLFNEIKIEYLNITSNISNKKVWFILKKAFENRSFLTCRILNPIKNGFAVGFCGVVGYLPKKYYVFGKKLIVSVFTIVNVDLFKETFIVSQKRINKLTSRCLYKLNSKIKYLLKKNLI